MNTLLPVLCAAFLLTGCGHHVGFHSSHVGLHYEPHYTQPSAIPCYGNSRQRHTFYYGSDAKWHYFQSRRDMRLDRYKVPRTSLVWKDTFPVNGGKVYVERDRFGYLVPIPPGEQR